MGSKPSSLKLTNENYLSNWSRRLLDVKNNPIKAKDTFDKKFPLECELRPLNAIKLIEKIKISKSDLRKIFTIAVMIDNKEIINILIDYYFDELKYMKFYTEDCLSYLGTYLPVHNDFAIQKNISLIALMITKLSDETLISNIISKYDPSEILTLSENVDNITTMNQFPYKCYESPSYSIKYRKSDFKIDPSNDFKIDEIGFAVVNRRWEVAKTLFKIRRSNNMNILMDLIGFNKLLSYFLISNDWYSRGKNVKAKDDSHYKSVYDVLYEGCQYGDTGYSSFIALLLSTEYYITKNIYINNNVNTFVAFLLRDFLVEDVCKIVNFKEKSKTIVQTLKFNGYVDKDASNAECLIGSELIFSKNENIDHTNHIFVNNLIKALSNGAKNELLKNIIKIPENLKYIFFQHDTYQNDRWTYKLDAIETIIKKGQIDIIDTLINTMYENKDYFTKECHMSKLSDYGLIELLTGNYWFADTQTVSSNGVVKEFYPIDYVEKMGINNNSSILHGLKTKSTKLVRYIFTNNLFTKKETTNDDDIVCLDLICKNEYVDLLESFLTHFRFTSDKLLEIYKTYCIHSKILQPPFHKRYNLSCAGYLADKFGSESMKVTFESSNVTV
jgi:hypothetical protein